MLRVLARVLARVALPALFLVIIMSVSNVTDEVGGARQARGAALLRSWRWGLYEL